MINSLKSACDDMVSREVDRLARLTPCELMRLSPKSEVITVEGATAKFSQTVADFGDIRHIGVILLIPGTLGCGRQQFQGGIKVQLRSERMSDDEASDIFD